MTPRLFRVAAVPLALGMAGLSGCDTGPAPVLAPEPEANLSRAGFDIAGAHRQYGPPAKLGNGMARAYVVLDARPGQAPLEVGVALDARSLEGLSPTEPSMLHLHLPALTPQPYRFVMLDWNPAGHEPPGVYGTPHFDFHFYTVPREEVEAIVPSDPNFADQANDLPTGDYVPPFYTVLAPPGLTPAHVAVPIMGVHWIDVRSPEVQGCSATPAATRPSRLRSSMAPGRGASPSSSR